MSTTADSSTIVKEITIHAAAAKVFAALTDPTQLPQWWGEEGRYQVDRMTSDLRVGGHWRSEGTSADGNTFSVEGTYRVVDPPHALEMTWKHDWEADAEETVVRYDLAERQGSTHLRVTHSGFTSASSREAHAGGWDRVLSWMAAYVMNAGR